MEFQDPKSCSVLKDPPCSFSSNSQISPQRNFANALILAAFSRVGMARRCPAFLRSIFVKLLLDKCNFFLPIVQLLVESGSQKRPQNLAVDGPGDIPHPSQILATQGNLCPLQGCKVKGDRFFYTFGLGLPHGVQEEFCGPGVQE